MKVKVNFLAVLRSLAKSNSVEVEAPQGSKVEDVIRLACMNNEALFKRVFESSGEVRGDIIVLVDGVDVNLLGGLSALINDVKEITLIPSVHGGAPSYESRNC
ncbi:MAG: MoaD/ThiS family protein [Candidatus Nezhaarchaeales archaeon]